MPARRGVPQIEVTFDIDANGIVNVTAKDLGTGKEQHVTITSSTNMSKEDIDRAVKDAEKFAEEDKKVKEAVDTKNEAEAILYQSESTLNEMGDKVDAADKATIEAEASKLREAINTNDTETIKKATEAFKKAFYAVAEKIYKANAPQGDMGGAQGGAGFQNDDGSFNADFTEK
jgi:molecular chaperone DnaK